MLQFGLWGLKDQRIDIVTMILLGEVICNNFLVRMRFSLHVRCFFIDMS